MPPEDEQDIPRQAIGEDKIVFPKLGGEESKEAAASGINAKRYEEERSKRLTERFLYVLLLVILFDAYIFTQFTSWAAPIVIFVLQLIGLIVVADQCEVATVELLMNRVEGVLKKTPAETPDE